MSLHYWIEGHAESNSFPIHCLATILNRMESPEDSELKLLHVICERHPPIAFTDEEIHRQMLFKLSCPCKRSHSVSHLGFMLLETFEYTMESATQQVEMVKITNMEYPWFTTLGHRVLRQQKTVKESFLSPCFVFALFYIFCH